MKILLEKINKKEIVLKIKTLFDKGAFHILVGNFIMKFIGLFGSIFIVRLLSKSEYGTLGYIENLYSYGYIFAGLGLNAASLRYGVIIKEKECKKGLYSFITKAQFAFNIFLVGIIILFAWLYPHPSEYSGATELLMIIILGLPFQDIQNTNLSYERSQLSNKRYMYLSLFAATISVIMRVIGAYFGQLKGTIVFRVLAEIISCVVIVYIVYEKYLHGGKKIVLNRKIKKEIFKFSINNMIANGIWILFMITDTFLISQLLNSPEILADYKVAYAMPSNITIITSAIAVFATPYFVNHEKDSKWVQRNYIKVLVANIAIVGSIALIMFLFTPQLISILYGKEYLNVIPLMRALLVAHFFNAGIKTITASLLAAMGFAKENMLISVFAFLMQVVMATIALKKWGIMGLVTSNIFVYLIMSLVLVGVFVKKFGLKKRERK